MTDFEKTAEQIAQASADYAMINHFLRCNLNSDSDYAEYSAALDRIYIRAKQADKPIAWMDADDNIFYTEEDAFKTGVTPIRPLLSGPEQITPNYNATSDERLMEMPEFYKHEVTDTYDWSEWVNPNNDSYMMKCCDCGLVHEMQFKVAKYSEGDECEFVDDPDLQPVFRARRAEEAWQETDTAHRAGALTQSADYSDCHGSDWTERDGEYLK